MNKWVKFWYWIFAGLVVLGTVPWTLGSLGLSGITLYLTLIFVGLLVFKDNLPNKKKCIWIAIVILSYLSLQTFVAPSISGRVIDKTTGAPLKDAIVHVEYCLLLPTVAGNIPSRMGEKLAVTDRDGRYRISPKIGINFFLVSGPSIYVKILHPLWEANRKVIDPDYFWLLNKFPAGIRHDEELLSLREKYREGRIAGIRSGEYDSFNNELSQIKHYYIEYAKQLGLKVDKLGIRNKWAEISKTYFENVDIDWILNSGNEKD